MTSDAAELTEEVEQLCDLVPVSELPQQQFPLLLCPERTPSCSPSGRYHVYNIPRKGNIKFKLCRVFIGGKRAAFSCRFMICAAGLFYLFYLFKLTNTWCLALGRAAGDEQSSPQEVRPFYTVDFMQRHSSTNESVENIRRLRQVPCCYLFVSGSLERNQEGLVHQITNYSTSIMAVGKTMIHLSKVILCFVNQ